MSDVSKEILTFAIADSMARHAVEKLGAIGVQAEGKITADMFTDAAKFITDELHPVIVEIQRHAFKAGVKVGKSKNDT